MTLDILICSFNKGIVRIDDIISASRPNVTYIISYQYTDERYLDLIPRSVTARDDVHLYAYKGQGLSNNRNHALSKSTADLVIYADDDTKLSEEAFEQIFDIFTRNPQLDVALFRASTYTGKLLKNYPLEEREVKNIPEDYAISTIEMVFRRDKVQGIIRFDERFGLGTKFLTCGEERIWLVDALRQNLRIKYFPIRIIETSTMLKQSMIYVDAGVQRSKGAFTYYLHGKMAWWYCFVFAFNCTRRGLCHFFPMLRHLFQGIRYLQRH